MRVIGSFRGQSFVILVNSSRTHNFIDLALVKRLQLVMNSEEKVKVKVANGEEIWCEGRCLAIDVVTRFSWQTTSLVKPIATEGKAMDPSGYVKVKYIASGSRSQSQTILLRGSHGGELKKIKSVVYCAFVMAYHLILEISFLAEEEKVALLLYKLRLEEVRAREVLKTVFVEVAAGTEEGSDNEEVVHKLLHVVLEEKDEKAR
ncbi:putative 1-phosphatidylinositol-3-phosphate 5-kinase FAB1C [Malania oleifera]|uniref:putative 1-phosphatidylinositol-3-phosphate 5-kinase FAB1C n=1 Tax=Malania oleifera TaxID=397392 RepID=UPI0025ADD805|nr:putative 1-phosphatidylinositol-3-phosphate 5-kinase FAB1C [Malania oleifera]